MIVNIFTFVNDILYKKGYQEIGTEYDKEYQPYMVNRWLTMHSPDITTIVNGTTNRYNISKEHHYKLLRAIIGRAAWKKSSYIKGPKAEKETEDDIKRDIIIRDIAANNDMSIREVTEYIENGFLKIDV